MLHSCVTVTVRAVCVTMHPYVVITTISMVSLHWALIVTAHARICATVGVYGSVGTDIT
jgi:hypothetical protein